MINKSIGILTFHNVRNYGATLQAYALQQKLLEISDDVEIINYSNDKISNELKLWNLKGNGVKDLIEAILTFIFRLKKKMSFDKFNRKHLRLSEKSNKKNISCIADDYHILITGSDQVWNVELTDFDYTYFLDFIKNDQISLSYASSFGDTYIKLNNEMINLLNMFELVTLRENLMANEIASIGCKKLDIVCDPTLLLNCNMWEKIKTHKKFKKGYVFLFVIDESEKMKKYAENIALERGLTLISNKNDLNFLMHCSPSDFLSWIFNAEYIVTNSFHGTIFSLMFEKMFVCHTFKDNKIEKKRLTTLLRKVGLVERITSNKNFNIDKSIDWHKVKEILNEEKKYSEENFFNFVRKIVNEKNKDSSVS